MGTKEMYTAARQYHNEGLCVIPVKPRDKAPALITWEEYQTRKSTEEEVNKWFGNGHGYNIGIVHGEVSGNYVALDIDHDNGIFDLLKDKFPVLFKGRIEQSGSGEGYHIPLRLRSLPDFGRNSRQGRLRGNRTWRTGAGHVNIRARYCQTVAPPSIHPTGNRYRFIQDGHITALTNLSTLIEWLNEQDPPKHKLAPSRKRTVRPAETNNLIEAVKAAWPTAISVFQHFGLTINPRREQNGETRLLGNGGLLIASDNPQTWYNFSDEVGGGVIEAWGWQRFGSAYDRRRHFRQVLIEMAQAAGIDVATFYQRGDEQYTNAPDGNRNYWTEKYNGRWERMR